MHGLGLIFYLPVVFCIIGTVQNFLISNKDDPNTRNRCTFYIESSSSSTSSLDVIAYTPNTEIDTNPY